MLRFCGQTAASASLTDSPMRSKPALTMAGVDQRIRAGCASLGDLPDNVFDPPDVDQKQPLIGADVQCAAVLTGRGSVQRLIERHTERGLHLCAYPVARA